MKKLLLSLLLMPRLFPMEGPDIILCVAERPYEPADRPAEDIKHWTTLELDARDVVASARLRALEERMDRMQNDNGSAHTKTRAVLAVTALTSVCGVVTAVITYLTNKQTVGSN